MVVMSRILRATALFSIVFLVVGVLVHCEDTMYSC
jgi:hypothetical protein